MNLSTDELQLLLDALNEVLWHANASASHDDTRTLRTRIEDALIEREDDIQLCDD